MASKNKPNLRTHEKLYTYCPKDQSELKIVRRVPGGMFYRCDKCDFATKVTKGSYKNLPYEWKRKK